MRRLPRITSPITSLANVDGREVVLLTMEVWPDRVRLRIAAVQDAESDRLDARYEEQLELWGASPDRDDLDPPDMPGNALFERVGFSLRDTHGTSYRLLGGESAGSGTE